MIKKVKNCEKSIINEIVNIHMLTFDGFFLTFLGKGFLRQMYSAYARHSSSGILIDVNDNQMTGFLAYSENLSDLYKFMIKHYLFPFAWYSFFAFLRKPKIFVRLIKALLKPSESRREERYVELASIGVHPNAKSQGIGSGLIDCLKSEIDFNTFAYITLETDACDNEVVNRFYMKNGFQIFREYQTDEGRRMYEYRFSGGRTYEKKEDPLCSECCAKSQ